MPCVVLRNGHAHATDGWHACSTFRHATTHGDDAHVQLCTFLGFGTAHIRCLVLTHYTTHIQHPDPADTFLPPSASCLWSTSHPPFLFCASLRKPPSRRALPPARTHRCGTSLCTRKRSRGSATSAKHTSRRKARSPCMASDATTHQKRRLAREENGTCSCE